MKKRERLIAFLLVLALSIGLIGCAAAPKKEAARQSSSQTEAAEPLEEKPEEEVPVEKAQVTIAALKGPTGVGMAKLMQDAADGVTRNDYTFTVASAADEISGKLVSGEINIASVPTNLAAKLYAKTEGKIRMLAVNTLGVLSVLSTDETVASMADLAGKTVYSTGEGSNPEYILRALLQAAGVTDAEIVFVATNDELTAKLVSGEATTAMVPEPAASVVLTKAEGLKRAFSVNDAWEQLEQGKLMMGCVVALDSFVEQNADAVALFLQEYRASIEYAQQNVQQAAALCEQFEIIPSAAIAEKAIPSCNLVFITDEEMRQQILGYFEQLLAFDPASLGGGLPGEEFYYHAT